MFVNNSPTPRHSGTTKPRVKRGFVAILLKRAEERLRTPDLRFTIPPLCQLSYLGKNQKLHSKMPFADFRNPILP
jgi:hypothetical protein